MSRTTGRRILFLGSLSLAAFQFFCGLAHAAILIPTNFGNGADAEVREDADNHMRPNTDAAWGPLGAPRGRNRGGLNGSTAFGGDLSISDAGGTELASRIKDTTTNVNNQDRTSAMYMKFDISGLTASDLMINNKARLRMTIRNTNVNWSRVHALKPYYGSLPADATNPEFVAFRDNINNYTRATFNLFGLKPEPLALADPRRFGDLTPSLAIPNYNWIENPSANGDPFPEGGTNTGEALSLDETTWDAVKSPTTGPIGPLTWYNAPGITPDSRTTPLQDAGKFNFNTDLELLGTFTLPDPPGAKPPATVDGSARLPVGMPFYFDDTNGLLRNLIQRAMNEGRQNITLVGAVAMDGFQNVSPEQLQTTANGMLNFNYLINPKEIDDNATLAGRQLVNDNNWDPDGAGPLAPTGSPYSCDGSTGAGLTNCPGHTIGNNDDGKFSPTLILVPEPASVALACLGLVLATALRRRK